MIDELRSHFPAEGRFKHLEQVEASDFSVKGLVVIKSHDPFPGHKQHRFRTRGDVRVGLMDLAAAGGKYLYIYRDPFDVLESLYYFDTAGGEPACKIAPATTFLEFLDQRGQQGASKNENRIEHWCRHVSTWLDFPDVLGVSYEQLRADKPATLEAIAKHIRVRRLETPKTVVPTAIGAQFTRKLKRNDLWGADEKALFMHCANASLLDRLGFRPH